MTATSARPGAPPVDPRLRARRQEVRRERGRRRLRRLLVVVGGGAIGLAASSVSLSPLLDVDRVLVRGTSEQRIGAVRAAAGIRSGQAMAALDLAAAERAVEAVAWVDTATVRRSWPGTVVVVVSERRPVAALRTAEGRWALVDEDRRQVEVLAGDPASGLPRIEGLSPPADAGAIVGEAAGAVELSQRLVAGLSELGPGAQLAEVAVADDGSLSAVLDLPPTSDISARFGRPADLARKVGSLIAVAEAATVAPGADIDLRVPMAPVLTAPEP